MSLPYYIPDMKIDFFYELLENLYQSPFFDSLNNTQKTKFIRKHCQIPAIGKQCSRYWSSRGYTEAEVELLTKKHKKHKTGSPFQKEHWIAKGYSEEEAIFKAKACRPVMKEYWMAKGYSEEEAIKLAKNAKQNNDKKGAKRSAARDKSLQKASSPRCKEYWILRGCNEEESLKKVSEAQSTFSKEKCIEKYGEEIGITKWKKRQEKWQNTLKSKPYKERVEINLRKTHISKNEKELANILSKEFDIQTQFPINDPESNRIYLFDFRYKNKIIEYNGDFWHANPKLYNEDHVFLEGVTAIEKWYSDKVRIDAAIKQGYEVLTIWENDYIQDPNAIINKCKEFLLKGEIHDSI